ncbi:MAG TPA: carboxypeptidase-like regulatory domain-containing protein, partial [Candidatus Kapabacteria bacterium]|nr:carboxypeptidase-like regulatory domain-containing protein [Candidatus Kapabacteria bacterium]
MNAAEFRGSISGRIVDAVTKQPVSGVTIRLLSTKLGAVSTESGIYKISDVPVGTYSLEYK